MKFGCTTVVILLLAYQADCNLHQLEEKVHSLEEHMQQAGLVRSLL